MLSLPGFGWGRCHNVSIAPRGESAGLDARVQKSQPASRLRRLPLLALLPVTVVSKDSRFYCPNEPFLLTCPASRHEESSAETARLPELVRPHSDSLLTRLLLSSLRAVLLLSARVATYKDSAPLPAGGRLLRSWLLWSSCFWTDPDATPHSTRGSVSTRP